MAPPKADPRERRTSAPDVAPAVADVVVGCYECHGLNDEQRPDVFEHFGYRIHTVVEDKAVPFDEPLEHRWVKQWQFYGNSIKYATARGGPDYAAFKNGWFDAGSNLAELHRAVAKCPAKSTTSTSRKRKGR